MDNNTIPWNEKESTHNEYKEAFFYRVLSKIGNINREIDKSSLTEKEKDILLARCVTKIINGNPD